MAVEVELRTPQGELYIPRPTQAAFHRSSAAAKCILGGMGSGKSMAGCMEGLVQSLEVPNGKGGKGLIARYSWDELMSTTWPMFLSIIPPEIRRLCEEKLNPFPQIWFPNGFWVRGMNFEKAEKLGSEEYSWMLLDECGEPGVTEAHFLWMVGRRRNKVGRRQILLTGHPAGRNWVWKYFFAHREDPAHKRYEYCEGFQNTTEENIHLEPDYVEMMRQTYPQEFLERYFKGDFGVAEGMILDSFDPDVHVVQPFRIPESWPRYRGIDHGISHPTTCLWLASDFNGNLICYREYLQRESVPAVNVANILEASRAEEELIQWTVIDPAARQRETAGGIIEQIIQQYRQAGLGSLVEGDHDLPSSITRLKALLYPDSEREFPPWHRYKGLPGSPRLFVMSTCPRLRWEIEQWQWLKLKPGQIDRQRVRAIDDDMIACLRYIVMRRPQEAKVVAPRTRAEVIEAIIAELAEDDRREAEEWIGSERLG